MLIVFPGGQATVYEAVRFSAALRMAANIPRKVQIAFVEEVCAFSLANGIRQ